MSKKLNNSSGKEITEAFLKQDPEGMQPCEDSVDKVVVATHIPEMYTGVFLNNRDPGVALQFHYASGTHPLKMYTLYHGYEIPEPMPMEVIRHLENCGESQYGWRKNSQGHPECYTKSMRYIFQFKNLKRVA